MFHKMFHMKSLAILLCLIVFPAQAQWWGVTPGITNDSGVASIGASTGTGSVVRATSPTLTTPVLGVASATSLAVTGGTLTGNKLWLPAANTLGIAANGIEVMRFATTASGVNYLQVAPGAAGGAVTLSALGADGNINLTLIPKGAGGVTTTSNIQGNGITATQAINGTSLKVTGTKFTASGCSNGTTVGGSTAGSFASGTTGTCTVTVTMGNSQSATNGWSCWASNQTTPAVIFAQKAGGSTTTAVLEGVTNSADVISWGCIGY